MPIPIDALAGAFPPDMVKQRKGNHGTTIDYVDAATVTLRLNEVLGGDWSFTILDWRIDPDEVIVRGQMKIEEMVRQQFGGTQITRNSTTGEVISLADDLKTAASDALKKCASSFGVGLYLYGGQHPDAGMTQNGQQNGNGQRNGNGHTGNGQTNANAQNGNGHNGNGNGSTNGNSGPRISNEMIAQIFSNARNAGVPQSQVIRSAMESYGKPISQLTKQQGTELMNQYQPAGKAA